MPKLKLITNTINEQLSLFKEVYKQALITDNELLAQVISHTNSTSGKLMRPILVLLSAQLSGAITDSTLNAAVSLELLHLASLVHDDIVDDAAQRRGKQSVKEAYGNKVAVLSGDYFLASSLKESTKTNKLEVIEVISQLGQNLSNGELIQLSSQFNREFNEETYFNIIKNKTAALFTSCAKLGFLTSNSTDIQTYNNIARLGEIIGICFQLKDDLLDFENDKNIGKPNGNDIEEGKLTLPLIYVYNNSNEQEQANINSLLLNKNKEALKAIAIEKGGINYTNKKIEDLKLEATNILNTFNNSATKTAFAEYINFTINRTK